MDLLKPTATIIGDDDVNAADFCRTLVDETSVQQRRSPADHRSSHLRSEHRPAPSRAGDRQGQRPAARQLQRAEPRQQDHAARRLGRMLAGKLATCTATIPSFLTDACHTTADAMTNWDIHDDSLTTEGHVKTGGQQCDVVDETNEPGTTDAVDNCKLPRRQRARRPRRLRGPVLDGLRRADAAEHVGSVRPDVPAPDAALGRQARRGRRPDAGRARRRDDPREQRREPRGHQRRRLPPPELQDRGLQP